MTARPVERLFGEAETGLRSAGMALGQWYGRGDYASLPWSSRRAAAVRALSELDDAARLLSSAREALADEIRRETDRHLSGDLSACSAQWGVCPEHGNTLTSSGGVTTCRTWDCGRRWSASRLTGHCTEPATVVVADSDGKTMRLCAGHWIDARGRLVGATLVRQLDSDGAR